GDDEGYIEFRLHPKQLVAFRSKATEILYRGAAGGGKPHLIRPPRAGCYPSTWLALCYPGPLAGCLKYKPSSVVSGFGIVYEVGVRRHCLFGQPAVIQAVAPINLGNLMRS